MIESILSIVGIGISLIALFIVFWDHWKDDRLLTKRVQEFYEDIERLIFSNCKKIIYTEFIDKSKIPNEVYEKEIFNYRIKNVFYEGKVSQRFEEFSKYLGLTYYNEPDNYNEPDYYISESEHFIQETGEFTHFYYDLSKNIRFRKKRSFYNQNLEKFVIDERAINIIVTWLKNLRTYWKIYHKKGKLFRKTIQPKINFFELLNHN